MDTPTQMMLNFNFNFSNISINAAGIVSRAGYPGVLILSFSWITPSLSIIAYFINSY